MAYEAEKRIILAHQRALQTVRERIDAYALRTWNGLGSWRDADIDRFVANIVPLVESGQKQTAQLTNAYLDSIARIAGMPVPPKAAIATELRGVPLVEVYRRPAQTVWYQLSQGVPLDEAVRIGGQRLSSMVNMDMQMSNVRQSFERISQDDRIIGYERVLSGGESCALCAIAADQLYHKADLMPIHDNCNCDVAPVYASNADAMQSIRDERTSDVLAQLEEQGVAYSDFSSGSGGNKSAMRGVRVNTHGEIGPVLGWADQAFRGPADL